MLLLLCSIFLFINNGKYVLLLTALLLHGGVEEMQPAGKYGNALSQLLSPLSYLKDQSGCHRPLQALWLQMRNQEGRA